MKTAQLSVILIITVVLNSCAQRAGLIDSSKSWTLSEQNFVHQGFTPQVGDEVWVRLLDVTGKELVFEAFPISKENQNNWQDDVAYSLNEGPANAYLQVRRDPTSTLSKTIDYNYVWLKNDNHTYVIGLNH